MGFNKCLTVIGHPHLSCSYRLIVPVALVEDAVFTFRVIGFFSVDQNHGMIRIFWETFHFLKLVPVALVVCLWDDRFIGKRILAVTHFLNAKCWKSENVMSLVRQTVLCSLQFNFIINNSHVRGSENQLTDATSRMQWDKFRALAPEAKPYPAEIHTEFLKLLPEK